MSDRVRKSLGFVPGMALLVGTILLSANTKAFNGHAANGSVTPENIIHYLRERFGVPTTVKMTVGPFRDSFDPQFREATVAVDDGKQKKDQNILVSKDGRYLIVGNAFSLGADPKGEIAQHVREQFKLSPTMQLAVGEFRKSAFPGFYETTVTVDDGKKKQNQNFYVSSDNRAFVLGSIFNFSIDPRHEVLSAITTRNQPAAGPASAPVTMVEFADLECPTCARLHEFLEKDLLPKYGDKVRIIFKEFPLPFHEWSMTAAIASQCAYQNDPGAFVAYRSLIFKNQMSINATNARDMLLNLAAQAGIDSLKLAACVDSKATLARVEQNVHEGQKIGVNSTPTTYINGKPVIGAGPAESFYSAIDEALRTSK